MATGLLAARKNKRAAESSRRLWFSLCGADDQSLLPNIVTCLRNSTMWAWVSCSPGK